MLSMTGYGRYDSADAERQIEVEVRSVNHRFLKTQIRLPRELQALETLLETEIKQQLRRGSVSLNARYENLSAKSQYAIDTEVAKSHFEAAKSLAKDLGLETWPTMDGLLRLPGVVVGTSALAQGANEELNAAIIKAAREALSNLVSMRRDEGARLKAELLEIKGRVAVATATIKERAPSVVEEYATKLKLRLDQLLAKNADKVAVSDEAILREVALFADRADISEEIQRLESHLIEFDAILETTEVGRKLDFILQEMLREANTIASKASDAEIARSVIEVKTELERLREQAQNIE